MKKVTLEELPNGSLFKFNKTIALKTEYRTKGDAIEAYIIGSGEFFWGGTIHAKDQKVLKVEPIKL